jgi:hypothetical protein
VSEKSSTIFIHQRSGYLRSQCSEPEDDSMVPIGLNNKQIEQLSLGITGLVGTESVEEVAEWFSKALTLPTGTIFLQPIWKL